MWTTGWRPDNAGTLAIPQCKAFKQTDAELDGMRPLAWPAEMRREA